MEDDEQRSYPYFPTVISANRSREEARLEAREAPRYLLAKSFFDCREFDRCAAVFLSRKPLSATAASKVSPRTPITKLSKGKGKETGPSPSAASVSPEYNLPQMSQKALFLALYAKYMSGEKRKDEDSEMILGPFDNATTRNKELVELINILDGWFADRAAKGQESSSQGWLEYLYGIILIKEKSMEAGKEWLIKSVNRCPFNWSAWQELNDLFDDTEEAILSYWSPSWEGLLTRLQLKSICNKLPQNIMSSIFVVYAYASHQLVQSTQDIHQQLTNLGAIFPESLFLKTQRALLFYHSKGHCPLAQTTSSGLIDLS